MIAFEALPLEGLIALCQRENEAALHFMVQKHLGLVHACVRRFSACQKEAQELYQQGCLGLLKAIKRFDTRYGARFSTYAVPLILGEIRQFLRDDSPMHIARRDRDVFSKIAKAQSTLQQALQREPTITELALALRRDAAELALLLEQAPKTVPMDAKKGEELPLQETLRDPNSEGFIDSLILKDILSRLPKLEQWLIHLRFQKHFTQSETAKALHMTQVQVSRLEQKLRIKLLKQLQDP